MKGRKERRMKSKLGYGHNVAVPQETTGGSVGWWGPQFSQSTKIQRRRIIFKRVEYFSGEIVRVGERDAAWCGNRGSGGWGGGGPLEGDWLPLVEGSSKIHLNRRHTREHAVSFNLQNACEEMSLSFLSELLLPIGVFGIKGVAESAKPAAHLLLYMNSEEDEEFSLLLSSLSG